MLFDVRLSARCNYVNVCFPVLATIVKPRLLFRLLFLVREWEGINPRLIRGRERVYVPQAASAPSAGLKIVSK